jgi:hypothetical protein
MELREREGEREKEGGWGEPTKQKTHFFKSRADIVCYVFECS